MEKEFKKQLVQIINETKPLSKKSIIQNSIITSKKLILEIEKIDRLIMKNQNTINENKIIILNVQLELIMKEIKDLSIIIEK